MLFGLFGLLGLESFVVISNIAGSQRDRRPRIAGRQAHIIATVTSRNVQITA